MADNTYHCGRCGYCNANKDGTYCSYCASQPACPTCDRAGTVPGCPGCGETKYCIACQQSCWGAGNREYILVTCPTCKGKGFVEEEYDSEKDWAELAALQIENSRKAK